MEVTKSKAESIASEYYGKEVAFDPFTVIMIVGIIVNVISLLYKCYLNNNKIKEEIKNPNLATRVILARVIKKHCKNYDIDQRKLRNIILKTDFTDQELASLIEESKNA